MNTRAYRLGCLSLTLCASAAACGEPPPDTTPSVRIVSPVTNQPLPACKAIEVSFVLSGMDPDSPVGTNGKKPVFRLEASQVKKAGFGRVLAYFDGTTSQAVAAKESEPITVPGPRDQGFARPEDIVLPGARKITLSLYYNGEPPEPVVPSRSGEVTVNIVPNTEQGLPEACRK